MIAIIPAREGSKRLPGKNLKVLKGKPLIVHTIEAALSSSLISRVVVNTDSNEIARVAQKAGAEIPFIRPKELATDKASSIDVLKHTLETLKNEGGKHYESAVLLQATSPLRTAYHIDEAIDMFLNKSADSVISYCKEHHPITWHSFIDKDGLISPVFNDKQHASSLSEQSYFPNGAIYVFKNNLLKEGSLTGKKSYAYVMDRKSSIDIDTLDDFKFAEFLMKEDD